MIINKEMKNYQEIEKEELDRELNWMIKSNQ